MLAIVSVALVVALCDAAAVRVRLRHAQRQRDAARRTVNDLSALLVQTSSRLFRRNG